MKLVVSLVPLALVGLTLAACGGGQSATQNPGEAATAPAEQTPSTAAASGNTTATATKPAGTTSTAGATMGMSSASSMTATTPATSATAGTPATAATNPASSAAAAGSSGAAATAPDTTMAGAAGSGAAPMDEGPAEACNPADMTAEAKPVDMSNLSDMGGAIGPSKGPEMPMIEVDPALSEYTIYRPATFLEGKKYPIVVWANGGCSLDGLYFARFLLEITSNGFVIVARGTPKGSGMDPLEVNGEPQTKALDWIIPEATRPCSKFYRKLDTSHIAAMGQSCGGLMTLGVSGDKRLTSVVIWNSGMFDSDQKIYDGLHTDIAYFIGGPDDVAYPQAESDTKNINKVPLFYGNLPVGHFATYSQPNGGEFGRVGIGWLKWQLYGDQTESGAKMFKGADCELCKNSMWTVQKKMMD